MSVAFSSTLTVRSDDLPRAEGVESQPMMEQPPLLWSSSHTAFNAEVRSKTRSRSGGKELRMFPSRIVDTYVVTVKKITNAQYISSLNATVSDMSGGYLMGAGKPNAASATIPLRLTHDADNETAQGTFLTFGHCPESRKDHMLMIYAVLTDGSRYFYKFDVSSQAHEKPDENNVHHIDVELLSIPEPSGSGGPGMNPSVDSWKPVNIDIKM